MARKDKYGGWIADTYDLRSMNNRHICMATKVTAPSGKTVKFTQKMPKGEAIKQAQIQMKKHPEFF